MPVELEVVQASPEEAVNAEASRLRLDRLGLCVVMVPTETVMAGDARYAVRAGFCVPRYEPMSLSG